MITPSPTTTRSRIETRAWITQSSPTLAPAPITTWGKTAVREPMTAPGPTVTNGPIDTSGPSVASGAIELEGSIPLGCVIGVSNNSTARAKLMYGFSLLSTAHGTRTGSPGPRITAEARVVFNSLLYRGFARNVRSPG